MFALNSVGHFFGAGIGLVKSDFLAIAKFLDSHKAQIEKGLSQGAAVLEAIDPVHAALYEGVNRAGQAVLGETFAAIEATLEAVNAPLVVTYDAAARQELTKLFQDYKKFKGLMTLPVGLANPQISK